MGLRLLIQSNIYVSLCSSALFIYYGLLLEKNLFFSNIMGVFLGTLISYFFVRNVALLKSRSRSDSFIERIGLGTVILLSLSVGACLYSVKDLSTIQITLCFVVTTIVLLYERLISKKGLRDLPYFKPFAIAVCWTIICIGLHYEELDQKFLILCTECFIFIFSLNLLFDFKDKKTDQDFGLKSFTHLFPSFQTLIMIYIILGFSFFISSHYLPTNTALMITFFSTIFYILATTTRKKEFHFAFFADGIILVKCLFYFYFI